MKLGAYIMAREPISTVYFINSAHKSVCLYVYPPTVARQRLGKNRYRDNEYTRKNRIVGRIMFCAVRVVLKGSS
jgi:hypothetical protein